MYPTNQEVEPLGLKSSGQKAKGQSLQSRNQRPKELRTDQPVLQRLLPGVRITRAWMREPSAKTPGGEGMRILCIKARGVSEKGLEGAMRVADALGEHPGRKIWKSDAPEFVVKPLSLANPGSWPNQWVFAPRTLVQGVQLLG